MFRGFVCVLGLIVVIAGAATAETSPERFHSPTTAESPNILTAQRFAFSLDSLSGWNCGVGIEAESGDPVYAVADGEVAKVSPSDWGDGSVALIVRHALSDGRRFIAIYGRVRNYQTGRVRAGKQIATVGPGGYLYFGVFESADGFGDLPSARSQTEYNSSTLPLPAKETIGGTLCYARWFDPIDYISRRAPGPYIGKPAPDREPADATRPPRVVKASRKDKRRLLPPGCPSMVEPMGGSSWGWVGGRRSVQLRVSAGSGTGPTAYRFRVRRVCQIQWVTEFPEWVSGWVVGSGGAFISTPFLPPGDYWWEAQAMNDYGEGVWPTTRWWFHINFPPGIPKPISPENEQPVNNRDVKLAWRDPGDPDNQPRHHREFRVQIRGDWDYDSGWDIDFTSTHVRVPKDGRFQWRVAASDGLDESDFSPWRAFMVDTEAPEITVSGPPTGRWTNNGTINWTISDARSGLNSSVIKWDSGTESKLTDRGTASIPEGKHSFTIRAADKAGNVASKSFGDYWIDITKPTVSVALNPSQPNGSQGGYIDSCTLSASAQDSASGVDGITCQVSDIRGTRYGGPILIAGVGAHYYSVKAVDLAGNESQTLNGSIVIEHPSLAAPKPVTPPPGAVVPIEHSSPTPTPLPVVRPSQAPPPEQHSAPPGGSSTTPVEPTESSSPASNGTQTPPPASDSSGSSSTSGGSSDTQPPPPEHSNAKPVPVM